MLTHARSLIGAAAVVLAGAALVAQGAGTGRGAGLSMPAPPPGDAANGKSLFASNKCLDCHRVGETGSRVGPDLSTIGATRTPENLAQSIVSPDAEVLPENRSVRVVLKDGT